MQKFITIIMFIWKEHEGEKHEIVKVLTYLEDHSEDNTCNGKPFQNRLESFYIGIKDKTHIFNKEELDSDFSWSHET